MAVGGCGHVTASDVAWLETVVIPAVATRLAAMPTSIGGSVVVEPTGAPRRMRVAAAA